MCQRTIVITHTHIHTDMAHTRISSVNSSDVMIFVLYFHNTRTHIHASSQQLPNNSFSRFDSFRLIYVRAKKICAHQDDGWWSLAQYLTMFFYRNMSLSIHQRCTENWQRIWGVLWIVRSLRSTWHWLDTNDGIMGTFSSAKWFIFTHSHRTHLHITQLFPDPANGWIFTKIFLSLTEASTFGFLFCVRWRKTKNLENFTRHKSTAQQNRKCIRILCTYENKKR